jgi:hypothetical protein
LSDNPGERVIDLGYIGRALQRLTGEAASLRDDMHVLTAPDSVSPIRRGGCWKSYRLIFPPTSLVIPAKAGIHISTDSRADQWIPAFAGMTIFVYQG